MEPSKAASLHEPHEARAAILHKNFHMLPVNSEVQPPPSRLLSVSQGTLMHHGSNIAEHNAGDASQSKEKDIVKDLLNRINSSTMGKVTKQPLNKDDPEAKIPKKRGPKVGAKPAANKKVEQNRQAQRNHRQRKLGYMTHLEEKAEALEKLVGKMLAESEQKDLEVVRLTQLLRANGVEAGPQNQSAQSAGVGIQALAASLSSPELHREQPAGAWSGVTSPTTPGYSHQTGLVFPSSQSSDFSTNSSQNTPLAAPTVTQYSQAPTYQTTVSTSSDQPPAPQSTGHDYYSLPSTPYPEGVHDSIEANLKTTMSGPSYPRNHMYYTFNPLNMSPLADTATSPMVPSVATQAFFDQETADHQHGSMPMTLLTRQQKHSVTNDYDYDLIGVEFILALEENCHSHANIVFPRRHHNDEITFTGHQLMMITPPSEVLKASPGPYDLRRREGSNYDLLKLVHLADEVTLPTGELTPATAFRTLITDKRHELLSIEDWEGITAELKGRGRCYGYGAAIEHWEVIACLEKHVMSNQQLTPEYTTNFGQPETADDIRAKKRERRTLINRGVHRTQFERFDSYGVSLHLGQRAILGGDANPLNAVRDAAFWAEREALNDHHYECYDH